MDKSIIKRPHRLKNRIGEINYNKMGSEMTIIEYIDANNITVKFNNGYIIKNNYNNFKNGLIKNPYDKTIYGVGYIGIDDYNKLKNISYQNSYQIWRDMLYRCYSEKAHILCPTYIDCTVCDLWLSYYNFGKWYDNNYYEVIDEKMHLDKDMIIKGNKIYSPDTCIFVPQTISQVFQTHEKAIKDLPIGVMPYGKNKYIASINNNLIKKRIYSKVFNNISDAKNEYIKLKRNYIYELSKYYKNNIPLKLYELLIKYSKEYTND